jgi:hypothetical protein
MVSYRRQGVSLKLFLAAGVIGLSACNDSGFKGSAKDPAADGMGNATPETPRLEQPGWIGPKAKNEFRKAFDEASVGQDGSGGPGGPGGPGGSGGSGGPNGSTPSLADELLNGVDGLLWVPCGASASKLTEFTADFAGKKGARVRLSGEFCPETKAEQITILFVIDHSGSMEGVGAPLTDGPNDKTSGGTCGRLRASELLVKKYAALKDTKVKAGVVNFSSTANIEVPVGDLDDLQNRLNESTFCGLDKNGGFTNYKDALSNAEKALEGIDGPKIVYFITDGSPTFVNGRRDGPEAARLGLEAARELRKLDDLSLNALFVGFRGNKAENPRAYLEQITGSPESVRVVADAEDLVKAAASLGVGGVKLSKADTRVVLQNGTEESSVGMAKLILNPAKSGSVHIWATEPFVLVGAKDQVVTNTLTAAVKVPGGEELRTVAKIKFKQLN